MHDCGYEDHIEFCYNIYNFNWEGYTMISSIVWSGKVGENSCEL